MCLGARTGNNPLRSRGTRPPRLSGQAGLTLLELVFTAAVVCITLVLLAGALVNLHAARVINAERAIATARVATIVDELRRSDTDLLLAYVPPEFSGAPQVKVEIEYVSDADGALVTPPIDAGKLPKGLSLPNPLEVRIRMHVASATGRPLTISRSAILGR